MKTLIKQHKDQPLRSDNFCLIPISKDTQVKIVCTFGFHVFIEDAFNQVVGLEGVERKPLFYFLTRAIENNFFNSS